jgi:DNA polymerase III alpha subunit
VTLNKNNEIVLDEEQLVKMFLQGIIPTAIITEDMQTIEQYNHFCNLFMINTITADRPVESKDKYSYKLTENWYMPDEYKNLSLEWFLINRLEELGYNTTNSIQWQRVKDEYAEFEKRKLEPLLKYMIYLVDLMREKSIVWGVGRGSSVASYILYLIGVHKIDSIKYELDFKEFFR